jgi:hypothetical protein
MTMSKLSVDCLNEIIEYLEYDRDTLSSCILVNRLWCETSVRIYWRDSRSYNTCNIRTLFACLPIESKKYIFDNGIIISSPTLKVPMFKYASFCKILSISRIYDKIGDLLEKNQPLTFNFKIVQHIQIVIQEIYKMFMKQINSLKSLGIYSCRETPEIIVYPEMKDCLKNLSELRCSSNISSEFFYQLSQTCHNILSLNVNIERRNVSDGLVDLISVQKNLKYFYLIQNQECENKKNITSITTILPNSLTNLFLFENNFNSLSYVTKLSNLQVLKLLFEREEDHIDFEKLIYARFSQLRILSIRNICSKYKSLIKFLENNGKSLKEFYVRDDHIRCYNDNSLNSTIIKFCPNLRKLFIGFKQDNELEILKLIFDSCRYLETIKILCAGSCLSEKEALEVVVKYSQNIHDIILYHTSDVITKLHPKELEAFFVSWVNRIPKKSLSLAIVTDCDCTHSLDKYSKNMEIINKYIKLGVIKKFEIASFGDIGFIL